jgi:hypothetical protein
MVETGKHFTKNGHWQLFIARSWMAFQIWRRIDFRGRPTREGLGVKGAKMVHLWSMQSLAIDRKAPESHAATFQFFA